VDTCDVKDVQYDGILDAEALLEIKKAVSSTVAAMLPLHVQWWRGVSVEIFYKRRRLTGWIWVLLITSEAHGSSEDCEASTGDRPTEIPSVPENSQFGGIRYGCV